MIIPLNQLKTDSLRKVRKYKGMTQKQLADIINNTNGLVSNCENNGIDSLTLWLRMCEGMGVDLEKSEVNLIFK